MLIRLQSCRRSSIGILAAVLLLATAGTAHAQFDPPPNPAKVTDARFHDYQIEYGVESWELNAMDPGTLIRLITEAVVALRDEDLWDEEVTREEQERGRLQKTSNRWDSVVEHLDGLDADAPDILDEEE